MPLDMQITRRQKKIGGRSEKQYPVLVIRLFLWDFARIAFKKLRASTFIARVKQFSV